MGKITKFIRLLNHKIDKDNKIKGIILAIGIVLLWFYVVFSFMG